MATNTSKVFIDIITQFTGTKSVKKAETSFDKLAKSVARYASAAAAAEFSRRSVKAFLADDAAAKQLEKTLTNLGIYFDSGVLSNYIQELQDTTGVLDDQLRPAFQSLAVATGDYTKAQNLLNTALDVSQATGKSLGAVSTALSRAYLGNYTAISKLGAGISKAEIAAGDFDAIQQKLNKNFGGSAAAAAGTYAGKIRILKAAFTDVQEIIGKGFVDSFGYLSKEGGSVTKFTDAMRSSATYVSDIIRGLGVIDAKLLSIGSKSGKGGFLSELLSVSKQVSGANLIANLGKNARVTTENLMGKSPEPAQIGYAKLAQDKKALALAKKLAAEEKKKTDALKKAAKAAADKLKTDKASKDLAKAGSIFDIDKIQIAAALAKVQSKGDIDRLNLMKQLLDAENLTADAAKRAADNAIILTQKILIAMGLVMLVDGSIVKLSDAKNPFAGFSDYVKSALNGILQVQKSIDSIKAPVWVDDFTRRNPTTGAYGNTSANPLAMTDYNYTDDFMRRNPTTGALTNSTPVNVNVLIDPKDLTTVVTSGQQNETASGIVVGTSRINKYPGGTGF